MEAGGDSLEKEQSFQPSVLGSLDSHLQKVFLYLAPFTNTKFLKNVELKVVQVLGENSV